MKGLLDNNHLLFLFQFIIAVIVLGVWCYLIIAGRTPPQSLDSILSLVIGFFFGAQVSEMINKAKQP